MASSQGSFVIDGKAENEGMKIQGQSLPAQMMGQSLPPQMMGQPVTSQAPPMGQMAYQHYPHPEGYGGPAMRQDVNSSLGGIGSFGMPSNFANNQMNVQSVPLGMNAMPAGFSTNQGANPHEAMNPAQMPGSLSMISDLALSPEVMREFDEKATR